MLGNFQKIDYIVCFLKPSNSACFFMGNDRLSSKQVGSQTSRRVTRRLAWIQPVCISINAVPALKGLKSEVIGVQQTSDLKYYRASDYIDQETHCNCNSYRNKDLFTTYWYEIIRTTFSIILIIVEICSEKTYFQDSNSWHQYYVHVYKSIPYLSNHIIKIPITKWC